MRPCRNISVRWLTLLSCVLVAGGCRHNDGQNAGGGPPKVQVVLPIVRPVTDFEYFTGRTDAINSVNVQARVNGYLTKIDFVSGAEVKTGQRLFKIDPRPYKAAYDEAMGQVALAEAQLTLAIADLKRAKEVNNTPGAISQQDLDRYAAAEAEGAAAVTAAQAKSESAKLNLEFTDIISPIDGVVSRNLLSIGNLVKQDTSLLTTVVSQDPMYVYVDVDDRTMLRVLRLVAEGKFKTHDERQIPIDIGLSDEGETYPHQGTIDFVNNQIDPNTGTLQIRGTLPNPLVRKSGGPRLLKPGLFVRVRLPIGLQYDALLVPQKALGTDQGRKNLFVVKEDNTVEYRPVDTGPQQADELQVVRPVPMVVTEDGLREATAPEIAKGKTVPSITATDRIIVGGLQRVHPKMIVSPTLWTPPTPAEPASTTPNTETRAEPAPAKKKQAPADVHPSDKDKSLTPPAGADGSIKKNPH